MTSEVMNTDLKHQDNNSVSGCIYIYMYTLHIHKVMQIRKAWSVMLVRVVFVQQSICSYNMHMAKADLIRSYVC